MTQQDLSEFRCSDSDGGAAAGGDGAEKSGVKYVSWTNQNSLFWSCDW